jgi:hypothetical protein
MDIRKRHPLAVLMVSTCFAVASVYLIGSCGATRHTAAVNTPPSAAFEVFDDASTADDLLPREAAAALSQSPEPEFTEVDIRDARRVLAEDPVWLVPTTNDELCLVRVVYPLVATAHGKALSPATTHTCTTEAAAQAGRLVETESLAASPSGSRSTRVVGVAPNGVLTVAITSTVHTHTTVAVDRNAYETVLDDPDVVTFVTHRDHRPVTQAVPLAFFNSLTASRQPSYSSSGSALSPSSAGPRRSR